MARKDLLKNLMDPDAAAGKGEDAPAPRFSRGAIGAVGQSIAELRKRSVVELPADMIDPGGLHDRLGRDEEGDGALRDSIRTYGQQVPVLVRHDPNHEGRYQVVYGRRRVAALKALKLPVKAMIRDLNDRDLIMAQGQENTARRDLSFIEKANFAAQMRDAGYERKVICDALSIDKTVVSRMLAIIDAVPPRLLHAIGAAPSAGRDRWLRLVHSLDGGSNAAPLIEVATDAAGDSDARFDAVLRASTARKRLARPVAEPLAGADGAPLGRFKRTQHGITLSFEQAGGFDDWLKDNIVRLHRDWQKASADEGGSDRAANEEEQNGGTKGQ